MKYEKNSSVVIHPDLSIAQKLVYEPLGFTCQNIAKEMESAEYGAYTFELNSKRIKFRVAKITPTKVGQFVTLWKRNGTGPILPYDLADSIDLFVINVRHAKHIGQFVFPKAVLYEKGIVSKENKGGKRAMRVYPAWDITNNRQAAKTQAWQLMYFFEYQIDGDIDIMKAQQLFQ